MTEIGRLDRDTGRKCALILERIIELVNEGKEVLLDADLGGNSLTVSVRNRYTHVGTPDGDFRLLVLQLHAALVEGGIASWAKVPPE